MKLTMSLINPPTFISRHLLRTYFFTNVKLVDGEILYFRAIISIVNSQGQPELKSLDAAQWPVCMHSHLEL